VGLNIVVTDYTGETFEKIDDQRNILHRLLPPSDEESASLLAKIDWYGDTYFNYLQVRRFLEEWDELVQRAQTSEERELVEGVKRLARRCRQDRNLLRFIGD
jgi:hypothetical protein